MTTLLNYSTKIPVKRTVSEITERLGDHGVRELALRYNDRRELVGVAFLIETAYGDQSFVLPADPRPVLKLLTRQHERDRARTKTRPPDEEQAARVAWRIVKDWIEAQLALVETGMVSLDQVMLPYLQTSSGPLYDVVREQRLALTAGDNRRALPAGDNRA